jgi:glycosyltransferase involved in cell wall biosynthesis
VEALLTKKDVFADMKLVLVADVFPPMRSSGAVQLRDLSRELVRLGHDVTVMVASPGLPAPWQQEDFHGVKLLRLRSPRTRDVGYLRRTVGEWRMPYSMRHGLARSPYAATQFDGVIWYSPTIFLGPMIRHLRAMSACPGYLIIRDIFPEWALDMGLLKSGIAYNFFKRVAVQQYAAASVIGVQTPGNLRYFDSWQQAGAGRLEVLQNWLALAPDIGCRIRLDQTALAGRVICVYAGNMGIAQGMGVLLGLAQALQQRRDIGFLFVGRGNDAAHLRMQAHALSLDNVLFFDEIEPEEIPGLFSQCHVGLVALDPRHRTHNIPGKFLTYLQAGLSVLASVNPGNDLVQLIRDERVGRADTSGTAPDLAQALACLLDDLARDQEAATRCRALSEKLFSARAAAQQVISALSACTPNARATAL